jgi:excinuclease ABC subunit B
MQQAIEETERRREKQYQFNQRHNIQPQTILKSVGDILGVAIPGSGGAMAQRVKAAKIAEVDAGYKALTPKQKGRQLKRLEDQMYQHARNLEFEEAARIRDEIRLLQEELV